MHGFASNNVFHRYQADAEPINTLGIANVLDHVCRSTCCEDNTAFSVRYLGAYLTGYKLIMAREIGLMSRRCISATCNASLKSPSSAP